MRGFRLFNVFRFILLITSLVITIIVIYLAYNIIAYLDYRKFIERNPFSTVPFWQDNRTTNQNSLLPIFKIEDVHLERATIAIAACCRNVRKHLPGFQRNIQVITALFGNYRIYLYESDSDDKTLQFLKEWEQKDLKHVRVHSEGIQIERIPSRTARLAICRNSLLQKARDELSLFDYYLVIDVDVGASSSFEIEGFLTNFIYPPSSWIAMTASQRGEYYDIWALRVQSILSYDCWERITQLRNLFAPESYLVERIIAIHQKPIPTNFSLIEVQSAFGGAALYNTKYLEKKCSYHGTGREGWWTNYEICEHVPFHQCLQQYAKEQKFYINPQFQIY